MAVTLPVTCRADLSDAQRAVLEPLLPKDTKPGGPPSWSKQQLIDGIRWRVRAGCPPTDDDTTRVARLGEALGLRSSPDRGPVTRRSGPALADLPPQDQEP